MRKKLAFILGLVLACFAATALVQAQEKEKKKEKNKPEEYSAIALVTSGGAAGSMVQLSIRIDSLTSDEEALQLAQILKDQGPDGLAKTLDKAQRGRIAPVGRVGNDINVARAFQTEKGRLIRLVMNRSLGFVELRHGGRSTDYQFSVIELLVNERGEGEGMALAAAKVRFNKENQLEVENLGQSPIRITNVRRY